MRLHLALLVLVIALAPASAWLSGWSFRRPIEVNVTTDLTDYQLALNITYDSNMNSDFSDLRFIDDDDTTELSYWVEEKVNGSWALVWVKTKELNTTNGTQLYIYYGNSGAPSNSDFNATFYDGNIEDGTFESDTAGNCPNGWYCFGDTSVTNTDAYEGSKSVLTIDQDTGQSYMAKVQTSGDSMGDWQHNYTSSIRILTFFKHENLNTGRNPVWNLATPDEWWYGPYVGFLSDGTVDVFEDDGTGNDLVHDNVTTYVADRWYRMVWYIYTNKTFRFCLKDTTTQSEFCDGIYNWRRSTITSASINGLHGMHGGSDKMDTYYDAVAIMPLIDSEPTHSIGAEEAGSSFQISIVAPGSSTEHTENVRGNVSISWNSPVYGYSTNYTVFAYLNGTYVANTSGTLSSGETTYWDVGLLDVYEGTFLFKVNGTETNASSTSEDTSTFNVELYFLNITNPTENGLFFHTAPFELNISCWRDADKSLSIFLKENGTIEETRTFTCGQIYQNVSWLYNSSTEGNSSIVFELGAYDPRETNHTDWMWYYSDLNYPSINLTYTLTYGFGTEVEENVTYQASDTMSFSLNCTYSLGSTSGYDEIANTSYGSNYTYTFNLTAGWNTLQVNCTDLANQTTKAEQMFSTYLFTIHPVDEETGVYDTSLWTDVLTNDTALFRFVAVDKEFNESYVYENITETLYLVLNTSKEWIFRMEEQFESQVILNYVDIDYAPSEIDMCVSPDVPNVLQTATSSIPLPGYAFAITRTETACIRALLSTESQYTQSGYGFYFYTQPGLYAVWKVEPDGWENKTALVSFSGEQQLVLDLEKILLMTATSEILKGRLGVPIIYKVRDENATVFGFITDSNIETFELGIKEHEESGWLLNFTETEAGTSVAYTVVWDTIGITKTDVLDWCYTATLEGGEIYNECIVATPEGRWVKYRWWQTVFIMMVPALLLFYRQLSLSNITVMSVAYLGIGAFLLPYTEPHWVVQLLGLSMVFTFIFVAFVILGLVK